MAPTLVFGVRAQIRQAFGLPRRDAVLRIAAKLVSDPNNQLPPRGPLRLRPGKAGSAAPADEEGANTLVTEDL